MPARNGKRYRQHNRYISQWQEEFEYRIKSQLSTDGKRIYPTKHSSVVAFRATRDIYLKHHKNVGSLEDIFSIDNPSESKDETKRLDNKQAVNNVDYYVIQPNVDAPSAEDLVIFNSTIRKYISLLKDDLQKRYLFAVIRSLCIEHYMDQELINLGDKLLGKSYPETTLAIDICRALNMPLRADSRVPTDYERLKDAVRKLLTKGGIRPPKPRKPPQKD